ncbi:MAG: M20/M25/M40 family metallo-hydrolase [Actinomycetota bacterium]|nr:M20/M25/M40 family metallo-hydrolase [Actinomycetota bacterium]
MIDKDRLLACFLELVRIDSLTFNEKKLVDHLADKLTAIGWQVKIDGAGAKIGGDTGNLIAHRPGNKAKPAIFFSCHLDTVEPGVGIEPVVVDGVVSAKGDTVLGADDKAGIAAVMEMAQVIVADPGEVGPIDIVFTVGEEKGLLGAKNLDWRMVTGRCGFVLDAAGMVGDITIVAPWQNTVNAVFFGKASHAGVSPETGVSAIQAAARAIETMPLGRRDRETTANIGIIQGGRAPNIIPDKAEIKGEARSLKISKLNRQTDRMAQAANRAAKAFGATVEVDIAREYDGFKLSLKDEVVVWAGRALESIGVKPAYAATGGGSDTNVFNSQSVSTVNLGVGYMDPHTTSESISVDQLTLAARLAVAIARVAGS